MMWRFKEIGHPVFKSVNALSRGILERKGGRDTIHFSADSSNTELLFRTIHSANHLSIYAPVVGWCEEFVQRIPNQKGSISEKFVAKDNVQLLKNVKPQGVNSLVQTPRSDSRASGNRLRECAQRCGTLEKEIQFTRVCEDATFWRRFSFVMSYKTVLDVDDGFGDWTAATQRIHYSLLKSKFQNLCSDFRTDHNWTSSSSSYQTISWHQRNWNSDLFHNNRRKDNLGGDLPRENRHVYDAHLNDPDNNPRSSDLLLESSVAKEREFGSAKMEPSSSIGRNSDEPSVQLFTWSLSYWRREVEWHPCLSTFQRTFSRNRSLKFGHEIGTSLWSRRKSNRRRCSLQLEGPKLRKALQKAGGQQFSDSDSLQYVHEGSNKTRCQYCNNSRDVLQYNRAIQGHWWEFDDAWVDRSRRHSIQMERILGSSRMLLRWHFSLQLCTIAGGRASKEGRQTIFFTLRNPVADNPDEEEPSDDISKPRQVHYHNKWRLRQDAVYSFNLARAQDKGLQFWQTRSHATIVCSSVTAYCIFKAISPKRCEDFYLKDSRRFVPHRRKYSRVLGNRSSGSSKTHWRVFFGHQEIGAKRGTRYANRQSRITLRPGIHAKYWVTCWEGKASLKNRPQCDLGRWRTNESNSNVVENWRNGYRTKSIVDDLGKAETSIKFSEEPSRTIHKFGNIELHELGQNIQNESANLAWSTYQSEWSVCAKSGI